MNATYHTESNFQMFASILFNLGILIIVLDYIIQRLSHYNDYKLFQKIMVDNNQQLACTVDNMKETYTKYQEKWYNDLDSIENNIQKLNTNLMEEINFIRSDCKQIWYKMTILKDKLNNLDSNYPDISLFKNIESTNQHVEELEKELIKIEKNINASTSWILEAYCQKNALKITEIEEKNNEFENIITNYICRQNQTMEKIEKYIIKQNETNKNILKMYWIQNEKINVVDEKIQNKFIDFLEQQNKRIADFYCCLETFRCSHDPCVESYEKTICWRLIIVMKKTFENFDFDKYYRENEIRFRVLRK